jgi:hypothetical protein
MANYAVITNGVVNNIIVADTQEIAEAVTQQTCVEVNEEVSVSIGWKYDGTEFIEPVTEIPVEDISIEETPTE